MKKYIFAIVSTFLSIFSASASEETVLWKEDVRGWFVGVDPSIGNACFLTTSFEGGSVIRFQFNRTQDVVQFIVGNSDWRSLEAGKLYPMAVSFGNRPPWTGNGQGLWLSEDLPTLVLDVGFEKDNASDFMEEFMRMTSVKVDYNKKQIAHLSLRGTYAAMQELFSCQNAMLDIGKSSNDPFESSSPRSNNDPFQ